MGSNLGPFLGGGPKDPRMGYTKKPSPWVKTFPHVHAAIFIFIFILFLKVNLLASTLYIQEFKFFWRFGCPPPLPKKESQNQILDNLKGFHEPTQKDFEVIVGEGLGEW